MKHTLKVYFLIILFLCSLPFSTLSASVATSSTKTSSYVKLFYFQDTKDARASLYAHYKSIDVLAPQTYAINATGGLEGSLNSDVLSFAQAHHVKIMPLVTNKAFSSTTANAILDDTSKQDTAISALIAEAKKNNYWGWQVDFEGMDVTYRDRFSAFISRTETAFKQQNLKLSVAVVAQTSSNPSDYPKNLWNKLIGVYDYATLADNSDFISIMSYDDPSSLTAIASYTWVKNVISYSLQSIPASKISLGIPTYYWKWNDLTGKLVEIGGYAGIQNTLKRKGIQLGYDSELQAPYINYEVNKVPYTLWYENSQSIAKKISLIKSYKLQGFSAWVLGLETPSIFKSL